LFGSERLICRRLGCGIWVKTGGLFFQLFSGLGRGTFGHKIKEIIDTGINLKGDPVQNENIGSTPPLDFEKESIY